MPSSPSAERAASNIRPFRTFAIWALITVLGAVAATLVFDRLSSTLDPAPSTESMRTERLLAGLTGTSSSIVLLIPGDPRRPNTNTLLQSASRQLAATPGIVRVADHPTTGDARLVAVNGAASLIVADVATGLDDDASDALLASATRIADEVFDGRAEVAGSLAVDAELGATAQSDLLRADLIAVPIVLLLLAFALRSRAVIGFGLVSIIATVTGSLAFIYTLSLVTDVSVFAVNVVTMFAVGLTVDYGLLFIGAFQRHLTDHADNAHVTRARIDDGAHTAVLAAVHFARTTAGRTITMSGLTVAAALAGLLVFKEPVLRSLGFGGIGATLFAVAAANTLLPAMLTRFGHRMARRVTTHHSDATAANAFERLATTVLRRPVAAVAFGLVILGALGAPIVALRAEGLDVRSLPADSEVRTAVGRMGENFPALRAEPITVVAGVASTSPQLAEYLSVLRRTVGVAGVSVTSLDPQRTRIDVVPTGDSADRNAQRIVSTIRSRPPSFSVSVTGEAAEDLDFADSLTQRLPLAIAMMAMTTLVLLWAFTGSVIISIKAVVISALSLAASVGALVWGFQDGHLAGLLGFTPIGGLEPVIVLLTCVFAFGLSTDYEVFLLAAVLDGHRRGQSTATAINNAIRATGRIITTAAALLIIVFLGFATGDLLIIKQLGVGLTIAVLIDATLVRLVLVPASLALLGRANWWNPRALQRIHRRLPEFIRHGAIKGTAIAVPAAAGTNRTDTP